MDEIEIVQPRRSYEADSDPGGLWILPQAWKTPLGAEVEWEVCAGVSHTCLDGLRPTTGSTGPTTPSPRT